MTQETKTRLVSFSFDVWQEGDLWYASCFGITRGGDSADDAVEEVSEYIVEACEAWEDHKVF